MYSTLNKIDVDFSQGKLILSTGEQVYIETEDKVYKLSFDYNQFEELHDEYRKEIGENTVEELEDTILALEQKIEDLKEKIVTREQQIEALRDKYKYNEVF